MFHVLMSTLYRKNSSSTIAQIAMYVAMYHFATPYLTKGDVLISYRLKKLWLISLIATSCGIYKHSYLKMVNYK